LPNVFELLPLEDSDHVFKHYGIIVLEVIKREKLLSDDKQPYFHDVHRAE